MFTYRATPTFKPTNFKKQPARISSAAIQYEMATISKPLKMIGLFRERAL